MRRLIGRVLLWFVWPALLDALKVDLAREADRAAADAAARHRRQAGQFGKAFRE